MSEDKKYVHVGRETVKDFAEHVGFQNLKEEVCGMVAEDCGYRLREATSLAAQFMRKSRRKKLTTEDLNKALKCYDVEPILGHSSGASPSWKTLPKDPTTSGPDSSQLFCLDDCEVNVVSFALSSPTISINPPLNISAHWLHAEQYPRILTPVGVAATNIAASAALSPAVTAASSSPQQQQGSPTRKSSTSSNAAAQQKKLNDTLLAYYDLTTKAILGQEETAMKVALEDLRTNPRISPLLPYFVTFISTGVKTVNHDVSQLRKLLHTAKALLSNVHSDLTPKPYLDQMVASVTFCLVEPLAASVNPIDHWALRDYAAYILSLIIKGCSSKLPHLRDQTLKALQDAIADPSRPLCSLYGAVVGFGSLGGPSMESHFLPHLNHCMRRLETLKASTKVKSLEHAESQHVRGALISAVERWLNEKSKDFRFQVLTKTKNAVDGVVHDESCETKAAPATNVNQAYQDAYLHFGSSLAARLDMVIDRPKGEAPRTVVSKESSLVDLFNVDGGKTGEQMLDEFEALVAEDAKKKQKAQDYAEAEEEEDEYEEEEGYESDEKSDTGFADESLVVKSHLDPGKGIKLTLKLTKRSRVETPSSGASGASCDGDGQPPPHKKKKRSRGSKESSSHLGTPSPLAIQPPPELVFEPTKMLQTRPPWFNFRVLGMTQNTELGRANYWNFPVEKNDDEAALVWRKSELKHFSSIGTGKTKGKTSNRTKLIRASRSCSLFSIL